MKFFDNTLVFLLGLAGSSAFSPSIKQHSILSLKSNNGYASRLSMSEDVTDVDKMSLEDEVDMLTQEEIKKTKKASNLRNANGVDYAPWMGISAEDESQIRQLMQEKAAARRKRQEQERDVSGALLMDSQSQELSGGGLKYKISDGNVELEWATNIEDNTKGFLIKRRPAKTTSFNVVASYEDWGPLVSKGESGGVYRYLDTDVAPGGWVYRVTECDNNGREFDICQCLVEVETQAEAIGSIVAAVSIGLFAVGAVVGGLMLDPLDGY